MAEAFVKTTVESHTVVVFGKSHCPYTQKAKKLLADAGIKFHQVDLDTMDTGAAIQTFLETSTNLKGVPNVWVKGKHFGDDGDVEEQVQKDKSFFV
ncbi:thioredoxin-like protein [Polychytrium aggregatum]|uniref:thioredoxin-like protein n=1 Tax=Polychytrium aggregatum TaxID=110093 RepID=UPI0022FE893D|nr:thioredoxin-like protein [Polychytrium aggregatum]KAI9207994.1 thioredoxin-like protein [Polychytrium aggregatum]